MSAHEMRGQGGMVRFSRALYGGATVVWHVHAVTQEKATLLYSASDFRQLDDNEARAVVGRANPLLHWRDMLFFKAEGKSVYDFGGWYAGTENVELLRINQFKEGFGGVRTDQFNGGICSQLAGLALPETTAAFFGQPTPRNQGETAVARKLCAAVVKSSSTSSRSFAPHSQRNVSCGN